ncbi:uncharacterized protein LAJ45_10108 [Morchella importuna]|uniref:uncharacterized protein n=1 Tax=Morchella importuna TaxID=1174673 RepID=UPI001E8E6014|nr:uncharacterized protein LAJ45_10108 [Morchella importuna]KAH8145966.1 hypothetical protein LAJ45_10108 [Morchella importuna]
MAEIMEQVWWLLKKLGRAGKRNAQYYIAHPKEAWEELIAYARENPWKFSLCCLGIGLGIATIVVPLAIGFGPAGPILGSIAAGWQSGIGSVVAGSAFAVIQSMAMTGVFTAIGGTLIGIGTAIPLIGPLFGRFGSWIGSWFGSDSPGPGSPFGRLMSSLDAETILLLTAGSDAVSTINGMKPKPRWFLESKHSKVDVAGSSKEGARRRTLTTNSKETWEMVWADMDAWRDGTVREHALERFDVGIVLLTPKRGRGEEGFCEVFTDHETDCHPECWCVGDPDDV